MTAQANSRRSAISKDTLRSVVETACRAPSLHNSQPWRWTFGNETLHLFADHRRIGHHTDITGNEVILSCGAALDHLRVAAAGAGWRTSVDRFPDPDDVNCLAAITFGGQSHVGRHDRVLSDAISQRRTNRLAYAAPEPWAEVEPGIVAAAIGTPVRLDVIDESGRPALAAASRRSEEQRRNDASYRYELLWWTHHSGDTEGLSPSALPSPAEAARVDVAREFPAYGSGDRTGAKHEDDHSRVLVLSTYDDSRTNVLQCGEILSRVLLECTAAGLATCVLTHMMEVHASREAIRRLAGVHGEPQVLIRVGRANAVIEEEARTRRRPLGEVLQFLS
jgi:nitroreductase